MAPADCYTINGYTVQPGERITIDLPVPRLYTHAPVTMPISVIRGKRDGPRLFISAAIHGDEINGVEIVRRVLKLPALRKLRGMLLAIPIVNIHGFIFRSRYLPDRRDLNRSFPGLEKGSLAARMAHLFMTQIVGKCTHGVDLHSGAVHRDNLPQVRANLGDAETARLARAFNVPVLIDAQLRDGSLRQAAAERGMPVLLYEGGEGLRFDEFAIRVGVDGITNVLRALQMLPPSGRGESGGSEPFVARSTTWVRAPRSGVCHHQVRLGKAVVAGELLGVVADPFGESEEPVHASVDGVVVGCSTIPLVNEGDALFHIARFADAEDVAATWEEFYDMATGVMD